MKRGIPFLIAVIIFSVYVLAQADEFSVRFHSFGRNATIDLKQYLGESEYYIASQTTDVIVRIDQETGIATLQARPGWEGAEVVFFRTNESLQKLNDTEKIAKFLPAVPEILALRRVRDEELARLFEGTIDPSILDMIKKIKREEIKKLSSEIEENTLKIRVNDELDLKMELGYIPSVSMDFSLGKREEVIEEPPKKVGFTINNTILIILASITAVVGGYFYMKHSKKRAEEMKEEVLESAIVEDIKQLTLQRLRNLKKEIGEKGTEEFINIVREFFSRYFGIRYNFEFKELERRVKKSRLSGGMKNEILNFLDEISSIIYTPSEQWAKVYGKGKITKKDKKLITKLIRIIRKL